ncbi:uncharacterized protein LOC130826425 [Amaranthus tricolor]|uniref:uncharacterized protein LOC130826425 n=1 Tax=Amaranthus tricolor TaxID=29722 RepID=UPI00258F9709|nr:uncharacterized protein LOC130826425 [Amaranthus tricolor]
MMLRSSSTPILGSLLSSHSDSPNHSEFSSPKHLTKKYTFHQTQASPLNLITPSFFNSSPSIDAEFFSDGGLSSRVKGFRRVQSDGNLEGLASDSSNNFDEFNLSFPTKKYPRKPNCSVLQSIPSFSVYNPNMQGGNDEEVDEEEEEESGEEYDNDTSLDKSMAFMNNMELKERYLQAQEETENVPSKMHLAKGLGASTCGYNGGGSGGYKQYNPIGFGDDGSEKAGMAEYYNKMVQDNPGNPLLLRNYAEFLHKSKDLGGAEEYYSRAILMDPRDGEILSQYAKLTWELHRDEERSLSYFQRAVQASPDNSHVLAAYASFLWETEEEKDDNPCTMPPIIHQSIAAAAASI